MHDDCLIISTIREFEGHSNNVNSAISFEIFRNGFSKNIILSCALDRNIFCWDSDIGICMSRTLLKDSARQILKWDEKSFVCLTWSSDTFIQVMKFSVISHRPYMRLKSSFECERSQKGPLKIERISDDVFLVLTFDGNILVYSYSEEKLISRFGNFKVRWISKILVSRSHDKCVYLSQDYGAPILLVNAEQGIVVCKFEGEAKDESVASRVTCIDCIYRYFGEEILVSSGSDVDINNFFLSFYRTEKNDENVSPFCRVDLPNSPFSFRILRNRYLFVGDSSGVATLYNFHMSPHDDHVELTHLCSKKVTRKYILNFDVVCVRSGGVDALVSSYRDLKKIRISGIDLRCSFEHSELACSDKKERIRFLYRMKVFQRVVRLKVLDCFFRTLQIDVPEFLM